MARTRDIPLTAITQLRQGEYRYAAAVDHEHRFAGAIRRITAHPLSDKQVHVLAGVIPMKSAGMARYMRDSVSGITMPDELVKRMEGAADAKKEGLLPLEYRKAA